MSEERVHIVPLIFEWDGYYRPCLAAMMAVGNPVWDHRDRYT